MNKTVLVMVNEIKTSLRRKTFLILGLGVPIIMGAIALGIMIANRDAARDMSQAPATAPAPEWVQEGYVDPGHLIETLPSDVPAGRLIPYANVAGAEAALTTGEIEGYYVIPADHALTGAIRYVRPTHNPIQDHVDASTIEWVLLVNLLKGDESLSARLRTPLEVQTIALSDASASGAQESWIVEMFPTFMVLILYMVILMPASSLVNAITDEKKNRVMELLMASISPRQMLSGKILALGLLGLIQTALWIGVLWAVVSFGGPALEVPPDFEAPTKLLIWSFVYFLTGYAMYGALMAGLGALAPDAKDTRSGTLIVLSPLILAYMFMILVFSNPNSLHALVLSLFPLTAPVGMIARMTVAAVPAWQAVLSAVLQLTTALIIVRLVARMFRAQSLLSGQPFSIRRYYTALLGQAG